jgi:RNA polymerase sigma-70 factor (ECF subfamily)
MVDGQSPAGDRTREERLLAGLRAGDESAFGELIDTFGESMLRIAAGVVSSSAVAEEVVQETWLAVFTGVHRFQARSSLRTWIFRILLNTANTQRTREARIVPFSDLGPELTDDEPAVDPERFLPAGHRWAGQWSSPPRPWQSDPESRVLAAETLGVVREVLATLPAGQRAVVTLRDVQGWTPEEVSEALGVSRGNQRVLLHRARSRLRTALEEWMQSPVPSPSRRGGPGEGPA